MTVAAPCKKGFFEHRLDIQNESVRSFFSATGLELEEQPASGPAMARSGGLDRCVKVEKSRLQGFFRLG